MRHNFLLAVFLWMISIVGGSFTASAKVNVLQYDSILQINEASLRKMVNHDFDSLCKSTLFFKQTEPKYGMEKARYIVNRTFDFYFLLGLVLFLGLVRLIDPKYFEELWQASFNTGFNARAIKDKLHSATLSNILMNLFFAVSFGTYVYYFIKNVTLIEHFRTLSPVFILVIIVAVLLVYLVKYFVIQFSGWAFGIETLTENYLFNVFLVNKLLAIAILPFIIVMAFPGSVWTFPALFLSLIISIALFIYRYIRSWKVLGSFFQFSKFHFFTYLCASEILPLAVLVKFLFSKMVL